MRLNFPRNIWFNLQYDLNPKLYNIMKHIVCPLSSERFPDQISRVNALLVIVLLSLYVITQSWMIPAFLVFDYYSRGFLNSKYSLLAKLSVKTSKWLSLKGNMIDKAPKIFAARLGFTFTIAILFANLLGYTGISIGISSMLILFAGLECVLNFCLGCWVYTLLVQPFYSKG